MPLPALGQTHKGQDLGEADTQIGNEVKNTRRRELFAKLNPGTQDNMQNTKLKVSGGSRNNIIQVVELISNREKSLL